MGIPLLEDVVQSMEQAIQAKEGSLDFLLIITFKCLACHILLMTDTFMNGLAF